MFIANGNMSETASANFPRQFPRQIHPPILLRLQFTGKRRAKKTYTKLCEKKTKKSGKIYTKKPKGRVVIDERDSVRTLANWTRVNAVSKFAFFVLFCSTFYVGVVFESILKGLKSTGIFLQEKLNFVL